MSTSNERLHTHLVSEASHLLFICSFACIFLIIFNFTMTNIASVYIVGDLGGSNEIGTYAITFFGLGNAVGVPIGGFLQSRFNLGRLFFCSMLLFALLTYCCAISPTYPLFILFRFLTGLVTGPLYSFFQRVNALYTPFRRKKEHTAILVTIFAVVPVLGASYGGWIAYDYHWTYLFYPNIPPILFVGFYFLKKLQSLPLSTEQKFFDRIGYLFFTIWVLLLGSFITLGQELDWFRSPLLTCFMIIGSICFLFYILWDLTHSNSLLSLRLLKNGALSFALVNLVILFSSYFGMVFLLSLWLKLDANYTPIWIALMIGSMAIAGLFPRPLIVAKRLGKIDTRFSLGIAILLLIISSFHTTVFDVDVNLGRIATTRVAAGFAFAIFLPPLFRLAFQSFPAELSPKIMTIFQVSRSLASGLGASIYTTIWIRRSVFYHDRLGSELTNFSEKTKQFFIKAKQFHLDNLAAKSQLNDFLNRRSSSLALDDCFYLMAWILVGLLILLLLTFFSKRKIFEP